MIFKNNDTRVEKPYDTRIYRNVIITWATLSNRKDQRAYNKYLYKLRHLIENAFLQMKRWREIATRYAKNTSSFLAVVHIRRIALWLNIS
jgi:transposase